MYDHDLNAITSMFLFFGVFSLLLAIGLWIPNKQIELNNHKATKEWQRKFDIWNRLYYCARDDCVIDPTSGKSVPAEEISRLY